MLKVGSVLYGMCDTSNPPKRKFHIIVAEDMDSYAYVFINSNVQTVDYNKAINTVNIPITSNTYSFLNYDSYIFCSSLKFEKKSKIIEDINNKVKIICNPSVYNKDMKIILDTIKSSRSIPLPLKKQFNFF